jgi:leucyl aminopeptidase
MQTSSAKADILTINSPCIIVAVFEKGKLSSQATFLDKANAGVISGAVKTGDFSGKVGETYWLRDLANCKAERILLLGFGKASDCGPDEFRKALTKAATAIKNTASKQVHSFIDDVVVQGRDSQWKAQQCVLIFAQSVYQFEAMKSKPKPKSKLEKIEYCVTEAKLATALKKPLQQAGAIALGMAFTKDLGNLPGNICTPTYLAKQAKTLAEGDSKFKVKVLNEKQMADLGMHSLLSVAAGSREQAQLIVMEYWGAAKSERPTVLVGKGITFDTGGISLKAPQTMDEMKFDMCGAASVLGAMKAVISLGAKINLVGIIAAAENMPGGKATKPGDIVTSMSGRTIEILNTDAEGRLVLCDALTYAERYKPKVVIDIATLTGACVVALGEHASGLYSNDDALAQNLLEAGTAMHDRAWRMPLWHDYRKQLDSNFADLANVGGPKAGSVTAACFLSHFTENYTWAHLDIAGTAWITTADKGATGRPVPLLVKYLLG